MLLIHEMTIKLVIKIDIPIMDRCFDKQINLIVFVYVLVDMMNILNVYTGWIIVNNG